MKFFKTGKFELNLEKKTYVMGILNVTPDSFSDGNKWFEIEAAVTHALQMQKDGADIIDIGAQSTRPGCEKVTPEVELSRLIPVLKALKCKINVPISVDTFYPQVAEKALNEGADIINDVNGFKDEHMIKIANQSDCGCIVMHGESNVRMRSFFEAQLKKLTENGVSRNRICFDPGIGFGKTCKENFEAIKNLNKYAISGCIMLVGASRKSFIGAVCENPPFEQRISGTIAAHTIAILNGANIIRVHDVKEAVQAVKVADAILKS